MVKKAGSSSGRSSARPRKAASVIEDAKAATPANNADDEDDNIEENDPDACIPGVPVPPPPLPRTKPVSDRLFTSLETISDEGLFLKERLWPTLELALEKLILAIKYNIPQEIRKQYQDPNMAFTRHPEHAVNFDPIQWLATFLKRHNPYNPPSLSREGAAQLIQAAFRGSRARKEYTIQREEARRRKEEQELANRREAAATKIQAVYRGHSVRLDLASGCLEHE
eukprot:gene10826-2904_t